MPRRPSTNPFEVVGERDPRRGPMEPHVRAFVPGWLRPTCLAALALGTAACGGGTTELAEPHTTISSPASTSDDAPRHDRVPARMPEADCSNLDDDGDGLPRARDVCPRVAERWNGVLDEDGCPDFADDEFADFPHFDDTEFDREGIVPRNRGLVASWVRAVARLPFVTRFEVVGDAAPDEADGLAQRRAEALRDALVAAGVAPDRVLATGRPPREAQREQLSPSVVVQTPASSPRASLVIDAVAGSTVVGAALRNPRPLEHEAPSIACRLDGAATDGSSTLREDGSLVFPPRHTAEAACMTVVVRRRAELDEATCDVGYGRVVISAHGPVREVALMRVNVADTFEPIYLALRTPTGWTEIHPLVEFGFSSLSSPGVRLESLEVVERFGGAPPEVQIELSTRDDFGEQVDSDEFSGRSERRYVAVCGLHAERFHCRTSLRSYLESREHRRLDPRGRVVRQRERRERGAVDLQWQPDGTLLVATTNDGPGQLEPTLGTYRFPDLPSVPLVTIADP